MREPGNLFMQRNIADPASGTSIDYMQSKGVPYIYAIELRPEDDNSAFGFTVPARYIEPTGTLLSFSWFDCRLFGIKTAVKTSLFSEISSLKFI